MILKIFRHHALGLKRTSTGFNISVPKYNPASLQAFSWIGHDLSESALALLKNYNDPAKNVADKSYPVVTANMTYPDLDAMAAKDESQFNSGQRLLLDGIFSPRCRSHFYECRYVWNSRT